MEGVYVIGLHVAHRLKCARWITLTQGRRSPVEVKLTPLKKGILELNWHSLLPLLQLSQNPIVSQRDDSGGKDTCW